MRYIKQTEGDKTIYHNKDENIQDYGTEPTNQVRLKNLMDNIDSHEIVDFEGSPEQAAEVLEMTKYKEQVSCERELIDIKSQIEDVEDSGVGASDLRQYRAALKAWMLSEDFPDNKPVAP